MKNHKKKLLCAALPVGLGTVGLLGGWLFYSLVGCRTGTCSVASSPYLSLLLGGGLGLLLGVLLSPGSCGSARQDGGEPPQ